MRGINKEELEKNPSCRAQYTGKSLIPTGKKESNNCITRRITKKLDNSKPLSVVTLNIKTPNSIIKRCRLAY